MIYAFLKIWYARAAMYVKNFIVYFNGACSKIIDKKCRTSYENLLSLLNCLANALSYTYVADYKADKIQLIFKPL